MIRLFSILAGSVVLASVAAIAQAPAQSETSAPAPAPSGDGDIDLTRGAKAWADHCGRCHNLRSPSELNEELWDISVTHMRVRANLPGDLADDIKAFLMSSARSRENGPASASNNSNAGAPLRTDAFAHLKPGDLVRGRDVYSQTCIACHGADGKGAIEGIPDFTIAKGRLAKTDDVLLANMINGFQSDGSLMAMPPRGGNPELADQDLADALAYIRAAFGGIGENRQRK